MEIETDVNEVVNNWRSVIKNKRRMIFTFGERADIRLNAIKSLIYRTKIPLDHWEVREGYHRGTGDYDFLGDWRPISVGERWGGTDITAFFRRKVEIPQAFSGERVVLRFYIGGDALLSINGEPYQGMDPFRNEVVLTDAAHGGEYFEIDVEAYVNWHTGEADNKIFHQAELAVQDQTINDAYWDFWCAFKVLAIEALDPELRRYLEYHLWEALKIVPPKVEDATLFREELIKAQRQLQATVYESECFKIPGLIHLVGHSHLDLVFMWTYREYIRKVGRTHATMLRLMEQYPEFRFCQSMANTYAEMKKHYPRLFEQVKRRVSEGRWEVIGANWVEPDCNLISGESFVRQILYGKAFFQRELGVQSQTWWQPDVFGMTASLPQILVRSGIKYVMTTKMAIWNDTNRWTKNAFWWEGIDGSRLFTFVPSTHFIGMVDPDHVHDHWQSFSEKNTLGQSLYCFGWGDGGGGVDIEMLESARRYSDFMGLPHLRLSGAEEALTSIAARAEAANLPVWRDELYLEAHRGTFTNKALLKRYNRRLELLYREAEILASWAWENGAPFPSEQLHSGWTAFLTTQFHDSVPGTHITEVFRDLVKQLDEVEELGEGIRCKAASQLLGVPILGSSEADGVVVFNSFLHSRNDPILLPEKIVGNKVMVDEESRVLDHQHVTGMDGQAYLLAQLPTISATSYRIFRLAPQPHRETPADAQIIEADQLLLENEFLRVKFNKEGEILSLWDKEFNREVLVEGQRGNHFQVFEDIPGKYDAWDIVASFADHEIPLAETGTLVLDETGPVRTSLRLEKSFLSSIIKQRISLYAGTRQLVFETHVIWQERQKLLKVGFPVDINTSHATYDIAFGNLRRPIHRNTPYDMAKFEVPAHQWVDLSEGGYGVSLLNDCKYGHESSGKLIRLTLLKGSIYPDPEADLGDHHFTYALYPHPGTWETSQTIQHAFNLNQALTWYPISSPSSHSKEGAFLQCNASNVTLEAIKLSEDGQHLVVRLVERGNRYTSTSLIFDRPICEAWSCDLMENKETQLTPSDKALQIVLKPYEILTLRVGFSSMTANQE